MASEGGEARNHDEILAAWRLLDEAKSDGWKEEWCREHCHSRLATGYGHRDDCPVLLAFLRVRSSGGEARNHEAEKLNGQIAAVHQTLDEMGAPTHDGIARLNANGRLVDWLAGKRDSRWIPRSPQGEDHEAPAYGPQGRWAQLRRERDAYKAALERLMEAAKAIRWCVSDPYGHDTDITVEGDSWRAFRSVLAGESSTTEE